MTKEQEDLIKELIAVGRIQSEEEVYDTDRLTAEFEVQGFLAPFVMVRRKSDGKVGSFMFNHSPRLYWGFLS
jgi:hypothetical protein